MDEQMFVRAKSLQSCPTLCDPMDCSPPDSSVHGDSPGKNTGVACHALLQGIFPTQGLNSRLVSPALAGGFFTTSTTFLPSFSLSPFQPCVYSYLSTNTLVHSPVHSSVLHLSTRPPIHLSTHPFLHSSILPPIHFLPPNLSLIWAFQVVELNRQKSDSFIVVIVLVTQSCLTLCNPMDYIAHQAPLSMEILQQEYSSHTLLQRIFLTQGPNPGLLHCRQTLYHLNGSRSG